MSHINQLLYSKLYSLQIPVLSSNTKKGEIERTSSNFPSVLCVRRQHMNSFYVCQMSTGIH